MSQEQTLIAVLSGVVTALVMAGILGGRMMIARRRAALASSLGAVEAEETLAAALPLPEAKNTSERVDRQFDQLVTGTGIDITSEQMIGVILLCGVGSCAGFYLWRDELWLALLGFVIGLAVPIAYLMVMAGQRRRQIHQQMPDAIYLLSRSLRAGLGMEQGFHLVASESPQPLGDELRRVSEQVKLGLNVPTALQTAAQRVSVLDFSVFAAIISIHRTTGGQLPMLLDRLASGIRDRVQYQGQFRAATAMGRISAIALGAAVPLIFLWYVLFQPETVQIFINTPGGMAMLATAFSLEAVGIFWLYRLLRTDS